MSKSTWLYTFVCFWIVGTLDEEKVDPGIAEYSFYDYHCATWFVQCTCKVSPTEWIRASCGKKQIFKVVFTVTLTVFSLSSSKLKQNWNKQWSHSLSFISFLIAIFYLYFLSFKRRRDTDDTWIHVEYWKKRIRSIPTCVVLCLLRIGLNVKYTSCLKHLFSYFPTDCCCTPRLMTTKTPVQSSTQLSLYVLIVNKC